MADDLTTTLRFVGEPSDALAAIASINKALANAAQQAQTLFARAANIGQAQAPLNKTATAALQVGQALNRSTNQALAFAQASARLQAAEGNLAGASKTLQTALAGVNTQTIQAVRAQTQLAQVQNRTASLAKGTNFGQLLGDLRGALDRVGGNTISAFTSKIESLSQVMPKLGKASTAAGAGLESVAAGATAAASGVAAAVVAAGALAAAALAAEAAIIRMSIGVAEELAPLDRLAERTGIIESELFKLKVASEAVGVSFETTIEQIDFFVGNLAKAASEGAANKLSQQLKKFGIDAKEAANAPGQAFDQLAKKIGAIENPTQRMAAITSFFGEEGRKLVPVFIDLARNADRYRAVIDRLGGAEGVKRIIQSSNELDRELKRLGGEFKILQVLVAKEVIPAMVVALRSLIPVLRELAPIAADVGRLAANGLLFFIATIQTAKQQLGDFARLLVAVETRNVAEIGKAIGDALGRSPIANFVALKAQLAAVGAEADKAFGKFDGLTDKTNNASKAAQNRLRSLEIQLREEEQLFRDNTEAIKRQFDQKLIDEEDFVKRQEALIEQRLQTTLDLLAKEEQIVKSKAFPKDQRSGELERIEKARRDARRQAIQDTEKAEIESRNRIDRLAIQRTAAEVEAEQAALNRRKAIVEAAIADRTLSFEEGERELTEIARRGIEARLGLANAELDRAGANTGERAVAAEKIKAIEIELAAATEEAQRRISAARAKDLEELRQYREEVKSLNEDLRRAQIEALQRRADALQQGAEIRPELRTEAIRARQAALQAEAAFQNEINKIRIEADRIAAQGLAATAEQFSEIERLSHDRRLVEEQRFQDSKKAIQEAARQQSLLADPSSPLSIFGAAGQLAADQGGGMFDQFAASANEALASVSASAGNMQSILTGAFTSIGSGLGSMVEAFILTGKTGPAAFKKLAAGVIAGVVSQAAVKAIFEVAEGFAAIARYDPVAASQHFAAAKTYGIVAGVAAAAGAALGAASGGGATGGAISAGGGFSGQRDTRIIEQGGALPRQEPQVIIVRPEINVRGDLRNGVLDLVVEDFRNNGQTRSLIRRDVLGEG